MSAIGHVLVVMSLLVLIPDNDYTHSLSSTLSLVSDFYYFGTARSEISETTKTDDDNDGKSTSLEFEGLILARRGSKGIPHKNVAPLNGYPLIHYSLMAMIQSNVFKRIWVSTDDPLVTEYVNVFRKNETFNQSAVHIINIHTRAWYTATDDATSLLAVQEFLSHHPEIKVLALVQATSPLIQSEFLITATNLMKTTQADSVFSVTRQHKFRWSEVSEGEGGVTQWTLPLNVDPSSRPRRQEWSGELVENGMFYFMNAKLVSEGLLQGRRSRYYEIPKEYSLEIDTPEDLEFAEIMIKKLNQKRLNCLHKCEL